MVTVKPQVGQPRRRRPPEPEPEPASATAEFNLNNVHRLMTRRAAALKRLEEHR